MRLANLETCTMKKVYPPEYAMCPYGDMPDALSTLYQSMLAHMYFKGDCKVRCIHSETSHMEVRKLFL